MEFKNARYNSLGGIDCEINHPAYGWIPYTLGEDDEDLLKSIGNNIQEYDESSEPTEEEVKEYWRKYASLTRAQFCVAIKRAGILPPDEAIEAAKGNWPQTFSDALKGLPVDEDEAQIVWASVTTIPRNDVVLEAIRVAAGMTEEEVDIMFGWEE